MTPFEPPPLLRFEILEAPEAPALRELLAYWELKRAGRIAPRRADIDPMDLSSHLPNLFMLDVLDGGVDFRYRMIGKTLIDVAGFDSTGMLLSEIYTARPDVHDKLAERFMLVVTTRRPVFTRGRIYWMPERSYERFAGGSVPLSDDGFNVNIILSELLLFWP
jgi:hypothetical protein